MVTVELQQVLNATGVSIEELAEKTGLNEQRLRDIANGFIEILSLDEIDKICDVLQVTPFTWLIYVSDWMVKADATSV